VRQVSYLQRLVQKHSMHILSGFAYATHMLKYPTHKTRMSGRQIYSAHISQYIVRKRRHSHFERRNCLIET